MQKNNEITKTTKCRKTEKYILMSQHSLTLIEEMCVEYVCLRAQCNIVYTSRFARKCFISVLNPYIECFKSCSCINTQQIIHTIYMVLIYSIQNYYLRVYFIDRLKGSCCYSVIDNNFRFVHSKYR